MGSMKVNRETEFLERKFSNLNEPCIKAVILFGSKARGEAVERSDIDLLVLHEDCNIKDPVRRRRYLYNCLLEALKGYFDHVTVIDMELKNFIRPREVTALLLNIYWDGVIVYDKTKTLHEFLKRVKENIAKSGLKRVRDGKAYYWVLPKPLREVKIL